MTRKDYFKSDCADRRAWLKKCFDNDNKKLYQPSTIVWDGWEMITNLGNRELRDGSVVNAPQ